MAIPAGLLPRRHWPRLQAWAPVEAAAVASAAITYVGALACGIPGYLAYLGEYGEWGIFAFFNFLGTPFGFTVAYFLTTGIFRGGSAAVGDKWGDPVLTAIDHVLHRRRLRREEQRRRRLRESLEGPAVADRLLTGAAAGLPDAVFVVVASRQKPDWTPGTYVDTGDAWYRLGAPLERDTPYGLRTLYPLHDAGDLQVIRRHVRYDLPARPTTR